MADQTTLPTCTVDSLGGPKLDRRTAIDPKRDESAAEIMLRNACIAELFRRMGLSAGAAAGSVEARLLALEAGGGGGLSLADLMSPQLHLKRDDFDDWTALSSPGWDNGMGADPWIQNTGEHAGLIGAFANDCMMRTLAVYTIYVDYPRVRFIARAESWDSSLGAQFQSVLRAVSDDTVHSGVRIYDYGTEGTPPQLNRRIEAVKADGMGGVTATDICAFADSTNYDISWRIGWNAEETEVDLFVSINGGAEVNYGVVPVYSGAANYIFFGAPHVALGSGLFYLGQVRRMAIWTPSGIPAMEYGD